MVSSSSTTLFVSISFSILLKPAKGSSSSSSLSARTASCEKDRDDPGKGELPSAFPYYYLFGVPDARTVHNHGGSRSDAQTSEEGILYMSKALV